MPVTYYRISEDQWYKKDELKTQVLVCNQTIKVRTFLAAHKICKNLPHGFDRSADLLSNRQNHKEDFFKLCVLLKKSELYQRSLKNKQLIT